MFNAIVIQQPIGFLLGLLLVFWIGPTTTGGTILTIIIGIALWNILFLLARGVARLIGFPKPKAAVVKPAEEPKPVEEE